MPCITNAVNVKCFRCILEHNKTRCTTIDTDLDFDYPSRWIKPRKKKPVNREASEDPSELNAADLSRFTSTDSDSEAEVKPSLHRAEAVRSEDANGKSPRGTRRSIRARRMSQQPLGVPGPGPSSMAARAGGAVSSRESTGSSVTSRRVGDHGSVEADMRGIAMEEREPVVGEKRDATQAFGAEAEVKLVVAPALRSIIAVEGVQVIDDLDDDDFIAVISKAEFESQGSLSGDRKPIIQVAGGRSTGLDEREQKLAVAKQRLATTLSRLQILVNHIDPAFQGMLRRVPTGLAKSVGLLEEGNPAAACSNLEAEIKALNDTVDLYGVLRGSFGEFATELSQIVGTLRGV